MCILVINIIDVTYINYRSCELGPCVWFQGYNNYYLILYMYNLGVFSKNGVENSNCSYFANMYVYMSHSCIAKMSVIACLVFLKIVF